MLKVDKDHAERKLKAEADSEVDWAYIQADMHSDKLLGAAAARWQASLARARNRLEEQEAHQVMDTYACSKGWETKWAEWKSDWLLEVINAHEAGECTDLDKREYIYHLQLIPPDKYDSTVEACVLNSREERRQAAKAEQRYCLDIPFRERSAKRQRTASQPPSQAAVQAALADVNKTLLKWLNKQQPSLNALVHIMDATHLVAFTSAFL